MAKSNMDTGWLRVWSLIASWQFFAVITHSFVIVQHRNNRHLYRSVRGGSVHTAVRMVLVSSSPRKNTTENSNKEKAMKRMTTSSKLKSSFSYDTSRGSEVDSRKIIKAGLGQQHLSAVRINHIIFLNEDLAQASLKDLQSAKVSFEDLARLVSACHETRNKGGSIGWVEVDENNSRSAKTTKTSTYDDDDDFDADEEDSFSSPNEHLDEIFPKEAREKVVQISTKPGDIFLVESRRGYHLVQILDVMADVRSMAFIKTRRQPASAAQGEDDSSTAGDRTQELVYKLETMGCQMNMADSERIEGQLQSIGIRPARDEMEEKSANVVILNTCSIRDHAEQKVYSYIGPHAKRKREGEDVTIIVAGCVAQQEGLALLRRAPEVDLVMGPQYANRIGDLLEDVSNGNQVVATEASHIMEDSTKPRRQSTVAAWCNVIYGCNERCAFCIVPTTRGVEQSRPVESIVQEVEELVEQGYKEVTLLGQNIDAFGRDMVPKRKFSDLIRIVGDTGIERLRFVTSHPRYMSLGVVDAIAETPSACESFHIPFQSGSNEILALMGRGHTREKYLHIIERIRSRLPDASITADAIVGFPGETEQDFQDTLSLMKEVVFDSVNTAAYSPRPNTPAATMDNQIDDIIKQDRLQRINKVNLKHAAQRRARMMGRVVEVLVEERNVRIPTSVMGRTRHGYIVYCEGDIDELRGKLVNVEVDTCEKYYLAGKIV